MPLPLMCLCFLLRTDEMGSTQVLLGRKHRGLGTGNIVGLGGKVEPSESARTAAVREVAEESGVIVDQRDLDERAAISFWFPSRPSWDQHATVFVSRSWVGEPAPSDEISPAWYDVEAIPFDEMWDDARHWLPQVLSGQSVKADFTFLPDLRTVARWAVVPSQPARSARPRSHRPR